MSASAPKGGRDREAPRGFSGPAPLARRRFLALTATLGGGTLLGLPWPPAGPPRTAGRRRRRSAAGAVAEIRMRSDPTGARVWFEPRGVAIGVGDTVRWVNESGVHTVTAYHPANGRPLRMPAAAEPWDSGYLVDPGATFEVVPEREGVYDFFCRPHEAAGMVVRLVVLGREGSARIPEPAYPVAWERGKLPDAAARAFPSVAEIVAAAAGRS